LTCLAQDWQPVTEELLKSEKTGFGGLCGIAVHPPTGDLYVNLSDRGFFRSKDQGATWQRLGTAELKGRTETPLCLMIDPIEHKRFVTAFVYGSPIMISNDLESPGKAVSEKSGHVDWCAVNWKDPGEGLILTLKHEAADLLLVSRDGGKSFEEIGRGYGPAWVFDNQTAVVAEAKSKTNTQPGLLRTTDAGRTFQRCGDDDYARALPKFKSGTLFWLTTTSLISTTDQGQTWKKLSDVKDGLCGPVFGKDSQHLFVLTTGGIRESKDGGATWSAPIPVPAGMKGTNYLSWVEYDAVHDNLYVMKMGSELFRWRLGK
jgi:hypothetical protein